MSSSGTFDAPDRARERKSNKTIGARAYAGKASSQYQHPNDGTWLEQMAFAPLTRRSYHGAIIALNGVAIILATFFFTFAVNLAKAAVTGPMSSVELLLAGAVVGIVSGVAKYMATGWNMNVPDPDFAELPIMVTWTAPFAMALVFRMGWLLVPGYWLCQTIGSLIAGGLLGFLNLGTLPTPVATDIGQTWFVEIIGVILIVFPRLFKHLAGASLQEEDARKRTGDLYAAGGRALATTILFQRQGYSFDPMVYLAGLIGLCDSSGCPNATPFEGAPAFYLLVPFIGVLISVVLYLVALAFVSCVGRRTQDRTKMNRDSQQFPTAAEQGHEAIPVGASVDARHRKHH